MSDDLVDIFFVHPREDAWPCGCCGICACDAHGGETHGGERWCTICLERGHHENQVSS